MTDTTRRAFLAVCAGSPLGGCSSLAADKPVRTRSDSADWPLFAHDSKNTGHNPHASGPKSSPKERWRVRTHDLRNPFYGYALTPTPVVIGDRLYVGGESLTVHDVADGTVVWETESNKTYHCAGFADETLSVATWNAAAETSAISAFDTAGNCA